MIFLRNKQTEINMLFCETVTSVHHTRLVNCVVFLFSLNKLDVSSFRCFKINNRPLFFPRVSYQQGKTE